MSVKTKKKTAQFDQLFKMLALLSAMLLMGLVLAFFVQLFIQSYPAFKTYGLSFVYHFNWEPRILEFGAGGAILGTISTTLIAVLIAVPIAFYIAFLLVEILPTYIAKPIGAGIDLLAAVPSIIYGMWGFCVLLPLMQTVVQPFLQQEIPIYLGDKPAIVQTDCGNKTLQFKGNNSWLECEHNDYLNLGNEFMVLGKILPEKIQNQTLFSKGEGGLSLILNDKNQLIFNGVETPENTVSTKNQTLYSFIVKEGKVTCFVNGEVVPLSGQYEVAKNTKEPFVIGHGFYGKMDYLQLFTQVHSNLAEKHPFYVTQNHVNDAIDTSGLTAIFDTLGDTNDERITDRASSLDGYFKAKKIDLNVLNSTLFKTENSPMGSGPLTAGIILALMILPYICAVMRDVLEMTPSVLKESAYGLGSTTWETTYKVTLRYGMQGFLGAIFLGLGRALGETMAVLFVIGNVVSGNFSLIAPSSTIASTLANSFPEASGLFRNVLFALGFVLLVLTFGIQVLAQWWLNKVRKTQGTGL